MMKRFSAWIACAALAGITTGAIAQETTSTQPQAKPVATVEGKTVTSDDLTSFAELVEAHEGKLLAGPGALLDEYILTQLWDKLSTSAETSTSPFTYTSAAARSILKRELARAVRDEIVVPREEMEQWYERNVSRYTRPERVRAYHLFMEISNDEESSSPEKVRARMAEAKAEADKGTSFSQLVQKYSEAASAGSGGEIGEITRRMPIGPLNKPMNQKLEDVFFTLEAGQVSDVVDTSHGLHLLYVGDRQSTAVPTLDDMITSGILPSAIAQDHATSATREAIAKAAEKYKAEVVVGAPGSTITAETVAYKIEGKNISFADLINLYGERFERFFERAQMGPADAVQDLARQAMDDELLVRAALDRNLDKAPQLTYLLPGLQERGKAEAAIQRVVEQRFQVTDEELKAEYDRLKETLRMPETEGEILKVSGRESSGTAETARAREKARLLADQLHEKVTSGTTLTEVAQGASTDDVEVTYHKVERHIAGRSTETLERAFDQATAGIVTDGDLSKVVPTGQEYVIARMVKRHPGEPIPFEQIASRIRSQLEQQKEVEARQKLVEELVQKGDVKYLEGASDYERGAPADSSTTGTATNY